MIKERLKNIDFNSTLDVDYDRVVADDHDDRCANDYCRCSTIENCQIDTNLLKNMAESIIENFDITNEKSKNDIIKICLKLTSEDFDFNINGGYYGEELDSVTLDNYSILNELEEVIDVKLARKRKIEKLEEKAKDDLKLASKIKDILIKEYGYLLENLKTAKYSVIEIETKDIEFPNKEYAKTLNKGKIEGYKNHLGICGVVKERNGKYKIIDGYHRITANIKNKTIKVILTSN